jgi:hypothetical protein
MFVGAAALMLHGERRVIRTKRMTGSIKTRLSKARTTTRVQWNNSRKEDLYCINLRVKKISCSSLTKLKEDLY